MEEDDEGPVIGLSAIMKLTGLVPLMVGILIIASPRTVMAVGPHLTKYGVYVGWYTGVLAILFGVTHWLVAIYVKENLHIFGRFFVLGHSLIALLEIYGWSSGLIEFEPKFLFGTMFPFSTAFVLLMYSIKPEQPANAIDDSQTKGTE